MGTAAHQPPQGLQGYGAQRNPHTHPLTISRAVPEAGAGGVQPGPVLLHYDTGHCNRTGVSEPDLSMGT